MNPENDHNYFSVLTHIRLSTQEKSRMRALLRAHVAANPPVGSFSALLFRHAIGMSFAAVLLLVGGTSVLAHRSMPDDFLYPLKLAVSDRVELVVAGDEEAKLDTELAQIARMLRDEEKSAETALSSEEREHETETSQQKSQDDIDENDFDSKDDDDSLKELNDMEDEFDDESNDKNEDRRNDNDRKPETVKDQGAEELRTLDAELRSIGKDLEEAEKDEPEEN